MAFDYIQTFYTNPDSVNNATDIMVTSINLYFKSKPALQANVSGAAKPYITVWLCEVANDQPIPDIKVGKIVALVPYDQINTSLNALTATTVSFPNPVIVNTKKYYGIVIQYSDPAFDIWINKQNDALVGSAGVTTTASTGSQNRFDGKLYKSTSSTFQEYSDRDLKFQINIAKFTQNSGTFNLVNKNYEFLTTTGSTGSFIGGEFVYQNISNATGTILVSSTSATVVGTGTTFTSYNTNQYIVVTNGTLTDTIKITAVIDNTNLTLERFPRFSGSYSFKVPPVGRAYFIDDTKSQLYLVDSNAANATFKFLAGSTIIGEQSTATAVIATIDRYNIDHFTPKFAINNPSTSQITSSYRLSTAANTISATETNLNLKYLNDTVYDAYILSRSVEVDTATSGTLYGTNRKSAVATVNVTINNDGNLFSVPYIDTNELDFFVYTNDITNVYTETRNSITNYDTEIDKNGIAKSKYISQKISFAENKNSEDIVCYLTAFRPYGTQIRVYAKIHNSSDKETFDSKSWTPLEIKNNVEKYSSSDPGDLVEYSYGFSQYPEILSVLPAEQGWSTVSGSAVIAGIVAPTTVVGDLIRVYDPLLPDNHEVFVVANIDAGAKTITVNKPITNFNISNIPVNIDILKYKHIAWNNIANKNIVRYVSNSLTEYDYYNSMQIKIVLLSDNTYVVPKVEQIQVIGVSA
jgi:hypothetical protein